MRKITFITAIFVIFALCPALFANDSGEIKPAPWSGYWWPRKVTALFEGWRGHKPGPLAKYDAYVQQVTGRNPGAVAWEADVRNNHYNPNAEGWEGHCNGWAAAAIMTPEPTFSRIRGGIEFTVGDQKALLSEQWMNCYCNFYGHRYWGGSDDPDDIYPDEFHRVIEKYIGENKSAVICDIEYEEMVWNFPMYKYTSSWSESWFDENKLKVKTTCWFVNDDVGAEFVGTRSFTIDYTYNLYLDKNGNVESGEWTGKSRRNHPDFIWVPTADAPNPKNGNLENPRLHPRFVQQICEGPARETERTRSVLDSDEFRTPDDVLRKAGLDPEILFN